MVRPLIRLVRDDRGERNWEFDSGAAALQLAFAGDVPLGEFVIEDGTLIYQNRQEGVTERLDSVNLALEWTSVRQPLRLSGIGIWRGEQVTFTAERRRALRFHERQADAAPGAARIRRRSRWSSRARRRISRRPG